ncbi:MAG: 1-phosphofructokinase family hexose kinase [Clostridia bacterium]|nr:1-phosphofructokinase family hexose kinase [Clostridia bacterium]
MKIITLTLNPAFDMHCFVEDFQPYHENLASITANEAGGKGVNISRALTVNGVENTALVVLGEENGDTFRRSLAADGIDFIEITVPGRIRENITLHTNGADETRISFSGFSADDSLLDMTEKALAGKLDENTILTFTGRVPGGVSIDAVKAMLGRMAATGAKIVIDSRSFTTEDIIELHPWLIKPNEEEIAMYSDIPVHDFEGAAKAAEALRSKGIENVMISLGSKGAMLCCADGCFVARAPGITALSTIGAGDSSIAGFAAAAKMGAPYSEMLRTAVCYGSAACMTEGTRPPKAEDVAMLLEKATVEKI